MQNGLVSATRAELPFTVFSQRYDRGLTLVTCYPFYFIGSAPDGFMVRAAAADSQGQIWRCARRKVSRRLFEGCKP
jgi:hypothetical protein